MNRQEARRQLRDAIGTKGRSSASRRPLKSRPDHPMEAGQRDTAVVSGSGAARVRCRWSGADTPIEADTRDGVADIVIRVQCLGHAHRWRLHAVTILSPGGSVAPARAGAFGRRTTPST